MPVKFKGHFGGGRHGKRQIPDSTIVDPGTTSPADPPTSPNPPPPDTTFPIPPSVTLDPNPTITVDPGQPTGGNPNTLPIDSPIGFPSSPLSVPFPSLTFKSIPSPSAASLPTSPPLSNSASLASDVTSTITTMSDSHPVTVTTIIRPAASLSPDDHSSSSFLNSKGKTGAVFAVVGLVIVAGVGFLAYRFYKTVQRRNADRETEEAARAAARVRVPLDEDMDAPYRNSGSPFTPEMTEFHNQQHPVGPDPSNFHSSDSMAELDDVPSGEYGASQRPHPAPLYHPPGPQAALDSHGLPMFTYEGWEPVHPRSGQEAGEDSLPARSNASGGLHPNPFEPETLSPSPSPSPSPGRPPSRSNSPNHAPSPLPPSQTAVHSDQSSPPVLPLPAAFGEDTHISTRGSLLGDHEDYHGTMGRILKIANE